MLSNQSEAAIQLSPYNYKGKKGITCYINAVCKTADGTPLGGAVSYEEEFSLESEFDAPEAPTKKATSKAKKVVEEEPEEDAPSLDDLIGGSVVTKGKTTSKTAGKSTSKEPKSDRPTIDDLLNS